MNKELKPLPLLPCPFCGGGETRIDKKYMSPTMGNAVKEPISVTIRHWCPRVEGQPHGLSVSLIGRDEQSVVKAWNTRTYLK